MVTLADVVKTVGGTLQYEDSRWRWQRGDRTIISAPRATEDETALLLIEILTEES